MVHQSISASTRRTRCLLRVDVRTAAIACRLWGYGKVLEDTGRRRPGSEVAGDEKGEPSTTPELVRAREGVEGAEDGWMRNAEGIDEQQRREDETYSRWNAEKEEEVKEQRSSNNFEEGKLHYKFQLIK